MIKSTSRNQNPHLFLILPPMEFIIDAVINAVKELYQTDIVAKDINLQETRKEFEGQVTLVTFPYTKVSRKGPEQTGGEIGEYLKAHVAEISAFNVIKGFLNISFADSFWLGKLKNEILPNDFAIAVPNGKKVMVEYSSPNTNKPLHLGHIRNNLLGFSVAQILNAAGYDVIKTNLVNDRGIHICKSMLAWKLFGHGETPESSGLKGDHLAGKYYVLFDKKNKEQVENLLSEIDFNKYSSFSIETAKKIKEKNLEVERLQHNINDTYKLISTNDINYLGTDFEILLESAIDVNTTGEKLIKDFSGRIESLGKEEKSRK